MNHFLKISLVVGITLLALSGHTNAQTVEVNGIGSSALFLELGLGASSATTGSIHATCVWSTKSDPGQINNVVVNYGDLGVSDRAYAWVAWTPTSGSCIVVSTTRIYAYVATDSVGGTGCLFNGSKCSIVYPYTTPPSDGLILGSAGEVALPTSITTALNNAAVNAAGTDIRPEDAEFAIKRALTPCGTPVATGSQYLGLGYINGDSIISEYVNNMNMSRSSTVVNFSLPPSYIVTPVGATPIVVFVSGDGTGNGFSDPSITNLSSQALAYFLDGTYFYTGQALPTPSVTGSPVEVLIPEPLSGEWNVMEYNGPNTTVLKTSQDVGVNQPANQKNCNGIEPRSRYFGMNIPTAGGGARVRAIGNEELGLNSFPPYIPNSLGYGFWSVANLGRLGSVRNVKYLKIDGVDPLLKSTATYTGIIPSTGSSELASVDLHTTADTTGGYPNFPVIGNYPIWSLLRLVNVGTSAPNGVTNLAAAAQNFVSFGTATSRPDFIIPSQIKLVRSHFIPPAGVGESTTAADGHIGLPGSACTAPEKGGDVGGVVIDLRADSTYCSTNHVTTGHTGQRR